MPSLDAAKQIEDEAKRGSNSLFGAKIMSANFYGIRLREVSRYAANRIPEIADTIVEIDNAMKWGFGWEIGVFETWDAIGVKESVERMKAEGQTVPANVEKMLRIRRGNFLQKRKRQEVLILIWLTANINRCRTRDGVMILEIG